MGTRKPRPTKRERDDRRLEGERIRHAEAVSKDQAISADNEVMVMSSRRHRMKKRDRDDRRLEKERIRYAEAVSKDQAISADNEVMIMSSKASSFARELASLSAESAGYNDMGGAPRQRTRGVKIDFQNVEKESRCRENSNRPAEEFDRASESFQPWVDEKTLQEDFHHPESGPTNASSHGDNDDRAPLGEIYRPQKPQYSQTHVRSRAAARNLDKKGPKAAKEIPLVLHRDKVKQGDRPRVGVAKKIFAEYMSKNTKFNFENLKEFVEDGTAEHGAKLHILNLGERKRQVARIYTFLQTELSLREELTEQKFRKILDQIDDAEAKRAAAEPPITVGQRDAIKRANHRTKKQKQLDSEAKFRERQAAREVEDSLMASLGNFGLQPQQGSSSADIEMS